MECRSVAPRPDAGLNTPVRQPPPDLVLIAGRHIRRRWLIIDWCWLIIDRRCVIPGLGQQRAEKKGATDDPCGDQQIVTMAIMMKVPAMAMVIATRLHRVPDSSCAMSESAKPWATAALLNDLNGTSL